MGSPVLSFEGEIDILTAPQLRRALRDGVSAARAELRVDMAGVRSFGSAGVVALIEASKVAQATGVAIRVSPCSAAVQRVLAVTRLEQAFGVT